MWSVCLHIADSQHPQRHWAWSRVWAAHQWQQQQSGKIIRQLGQWKDLTAGTLLREILVKCQGVWLNPSFIICWFFSFFLILLNGLVKIRFLSVKAVNLQQLSAIVILSVGLFGCRCNRNGSGLCRCVYIIYIVWTWISLILTGHAFYFSFLISFSLF